jgi:hypothetical protein
MKEAAKETVIIVHGTFAAPEPGSSPWHQPTQDMPATEGFIAKLNDALQKRGSAARCWAHCSQGDQGFRWSGDNSWVARTRAAAELGSYVLKLRNEGWCCHIVAHSHGGNVVFEALRQIVTSLPSGAPLGKIVTLGTPFMDTMSPILERIGRRQKLTIGLSWTALFWLLLLPIIIWSSIAETGIAGFLNRSGFDAATVNTLVGLAVPMTFLSSAIIFVLLFLFLSRKSQTDPLISRNPQMQPKFLAISSVMDEPWQLLNYMRNAPNPIAVKKNLILYLISSMKSHISRSRQVARIYERKSYYDLTLAAKLLLALTHLMFFLFVSPFVLLSFFTVYLMIGWITQLGFGFGMPTFPGFSAQEITIWFSIFVGWAVLLLVFARIFGTAFYSAFFSPFRWCGYCLGAVKGIFREIATYVVRSRGWSVVLAIAMGLEGYRHQLPLIEQCPSRTPFVKHEDMPAGAQDRALAKRGEWIHRHLNDVSETFSKLVVTSADITLLQQAIEADQTLVHAAYYKDNECIALIADWIAEKGDMRSNAAIAAEVRGDA